MATFARPTKKDGFGVIAGTIATLVVWGLNSYVPLFEAKPIPAEIASALTTLIALVVNYLTPLSKPRQVNPFPKQKPITNPVPGRK